MNAVREMNNVFNRCVYRELMEEFSGRLSAPFRKKLNPMPLLSENITDLPPGIVGTEIEFSKIQLPARPPKPFVEAVMQFKEDCHGEPAFQLAFLSKLQTSLGLVCLIHGHPNGGTITKFHINLIRRPKVPPPSEVRKMSKKLKGYPEGFRQFASDLDEPVITCRAKLRGFILDRKKWPLAFPYKHVPKTVGKLEWLSEKLNFKHSHGSVTIIFIDRKESANFEVLYDNFKIKLDGDCFEKASDRLWSLVEPLFDKNDDSTHR